jgi:integrase/recombinase XerD
MRVFRTTYKSRDGKTKQAKKWYVEFRDHREIQRRLPAFTDRKASEDFGRKVEKLVTARVSAEAPDTAQRKWIEALPKNLREGLARIDLLELQHVAAGKPLANHIDDFEKQLLAKGNTEKHSKMVAGRARALVAGCGFRFWSEISASRVQQYLADLRTGTEKVPGISIQTSNFYLQAIKQFCRWMVKERRSSQSPLEHLAAQNVSTDRRHDRRALTVEELRWLLTVTRQGGVRRGMSAYERFLVYQLAVTTGLRANEIRSLTRASFNLDAQPATVTVEAGYSKRRRKDVLPLRPDMVELLQPHLATKLNDATAFPMPGEEHVARMFRGDLAVAREAWLKAAATPQEHCEHEKSDFLSYRDENGLVADFHALRHTFVSNLANSGVHPKVAQQLARHSTITLTMDRYTHSLWEDQADAIMRLPNSAQQIEMPAVATGTDGHAVQSVIDARPGSNVLSVCLARKGAPDSNLVRSHAATPMTEANGHPHKTTGFPSRNTRIARKKNGGSAWESNPPRAGLTDPPAVLKTEATTRCTGTSAGDEESRPDSL